MRPAWRQVLSAFLIGGLVGGYAGSRCQRAAYHRFWKHGPDTGRDMKKLARELALDDKQQAAVRELVEKYRAQVQAMHEETTAKFDRLRSSMRADISKILSPEQERKFEAMAIFKPHRR